MINLKNIFLIIGTLFFIISLKAQNEKLHIADGVKEIHGLFNTSMTDGVSCYRIPAIVTATNGNLVVAIDQRVPSCADLKWSKNINIVVRRSEDNGKMWTEGKTIYTGSSAYSSLTVLENGDIGLFFEKNEYKENVFVSFSLEWLTDGKDK